MFCMKKIESNSSTIPHQYIIHPATPSALMDAYEPLISINQQWVLRMVHGIDVRVFRQRANHLRGIQCHRDITWLKDLINNSDKNMDSSSDRYYLI